MNSSSLFVYFSYSLGTAANIIISIPGTNKPSNDMISGLDVPELKMQINIDIIQPIRIIKTPYPSPMTLVPESSPEEAKLFPTNNI